MSRVGNVRRPHRSMCGVAYIGCLACEMAIRIVESGVRWSPTHPSQVRTSQASGITDGQNDTFFWRQMVADTSISGMDITGIWNHRWPK